MASKQDFDLRLQQSNMSLDSAKFSVKRWLVRHYPWVKRLTPDRYFAFRYPGGRIYWNPGHSPGMFQRVLSLYEKEKMNAISKLLKPGATFVDVGGNVGDYSLLAARIVGDAGRVICFEPAPANYRWIEKSIDLNGYRNIRLSTVALSDAEGEASLYLGAQCGFHTLLKDQAERQAGVIQVKTQTLDSVLDEMGCATVDMMKVDVEGAELRVLKGARDTLQRNPNVILFLELHPGMGLDSREVCDFLRAQGFTLFEEGFPVDKPLDINSDVRELIACRIASAASSSPAA